MFKPSQDGLDNIPVVSSQEGTAASRVWRSRTLVLSQSGINRRGCVSSQDDTDEWWCVLSQDGVDNISAVSSQEGTTSCRVWRSITFVLSQSSINRRGCVSSQNDADEWWCVSSQDGVYPHKRVQLPSVYYGQLDAFHHKIVELFPLAYLHQEMLYVGSL